MGTSYFLYLQCYLHYDSLTEYDRHQDTHPQETSFFMGFFHYQELFPSYIGNRFLSLSLIQLGAFY